MKKLNFYFSSFLICCIFNLLNITAIAQTGTITGRVVDSDGEAIIGVNVLVSGTTLGDLSDLDGNFSIENVSAGTYAVVASFVGYKRQSEEVTVNADASVTVDFRLEEDLLDLETIVVSGTFNPQSKLESTVSVTTLNSDMIEQQAPRSTTDLIDAIPGFYAESNLGESGGNVYPRGLPIGTGSFRYVSVREDGLPTFEIPDKVFFNSDGFTKVDLTIETLEGLRGGNAAVFSSNTPAGILNFRSKTGGPEASGEVKLTYGTQGMGRMDVNFGGPLTSDKKWRYNMGGFYRYDEGLRDFTGPANVGGQFKANFTRLFDDDKGYFRISGKILRDNVTFWSATPYLDNNNPRAVPGGPDLTRGTLIPSGERSLIVPDAKTGTNRQVDFGPNAQINYQNIGTELNLDLGDGWRLLNQSRYMTGSQASTLLIQTSNPIPGLGIFGSAAPAFSGLTNLGLVIAPSYFYTNAQQVSGSGSSYATQGEAISAAALSSGGILETGINGNGLVIPMVMTVVDVRAQNFINNLQITKTFNDNHNLTFGGYISQYDVDEDWNFNAIHTEVKSNPRLIDLNVIAAADFTSPAPGVVPSFSAGDVVAPIISNGLINSSVNVQLEESNSTNLTYAGFIGYEGSFGNLTLSTGLRIETNRAKGTLRNTSRNGSSDVFQNTYLNYSFVHDVWNGTIGLNYKITEDMALFGNFTRGTRYSNTQNFIANKDQILGDGSQLPLRNEIEEVLQGEVGYRMSSSKFGLTASAFWTQLTNTPFTIQGTDPATGNLVLNAVFFDARTIGGEIEAVYAPVDGLRFDAAISIQDAIYTDYTPVDVLDIETQVPITLDFSNNQIERIPPISFDLTGSYTINDFNIYLNWRYVGEREGNRRNTYTLPAFSEFGAGASYILNKKFTFAVQVINLFDSQGIVEGNNRIQDGLSAAAAADPTTINTGQFILPRSANFSVHYRF